MEYTLTDSEFETMHILASLRAITARQNKVKDRKMSASSGHDVDLDGICGEYAFCKLNNLFFDFVPSPRSGSYDCLTSAGNRVDIKTSRYENASLVKTLKPNPDVDLYVLATIKDQTVTFRGWATSEELNQEKNIQDRGRGEGYWIDQKDLKPFTK